MLSNNSGYNFIGGEQVAMELAASVLQGITLGTEKLGDQKQTVFAWGPALIDG